jgi:hypothetical protein
MASEAEIQVMKARRDAAKSALRFFKDIKGVRSTNNPFAGTTAEDQRTMNAYRRDRNRENTFAQSFEDAARTGLGNCDEKARICYASLIGNPRLQGNSIVTHAESVNYDHIYVVVSDEALEPQSNLSTLGKTVMIVDGWTEDWYFPNLSWGSAVRNGLTHGVPNPRQTYVRIQIASHLLGPYTDSEGNPLLLPSMPQGEIQTN